MKKVLLVVLVLLIAGAGVAYYQWNKPHQDVRDEKALPVTAVALFAAFNTNEQAANAQYLNKALAVTGTVSVIDANQDKQRYLILQSDDALNGVMCTMRGNDFSAAAGQTVTVKGFCSGFVGDVKLTDCVLSGSPKE